MKNSPILCPTREEGYLADEQPAVSEVEFAAENLSWPGAQWEGDGSGGGVLQILQGHRQGERGGPGLEDARLKKTLYLAEDSYALGVAVVTVHLKEGDKSENAEKEKERG